MRFSNSCFRKTSPGSLSWNQIDPASLARTSTSPSASQSTNRKVPPKWSPFSDGATCAWWQHQNRAHSGIRRVNIKTEREMSKSNCFKPKPTTNKLPESTNQFCFCCTVLAAFAAGLKIWIPLQIVALPDTATMRNLAPPALDEDQAQAKRGDKQRHPHRAAGTTGKIVAQGSITYGSLSRACNHIMQSQCLLHSRMSLV